MNILFYLSLIVFGFVLMEGVAWFSHKYIMHGFMWRWHKSHHEPKKGRYEMNDLFGIFFALISAYFIIIGSMNGINWRFYFGMGILLYGLAYFMVHDVYVHGRLPYFRKSRSRYFQALRFAHKIHHKISVKEGNESFGFLYVSKKYLNKYRK